MGQKMESLAEYLELFPLGDEKQLKTFKQGKDMIKSEFQIDHLKLCCKYI